MAEKIEKKPVAKKAPAKKAEEKKCLLLKILTKIFIIIAVKIKVVTKIIKK